ncbi:MAG TPA: hypothetical protein QGH10_05730, partial [Armatimonadota bacterium]|nr:hypothetical protein [Armatimonadota bacterium]
MIALLAALIATPASAAQLFDFGSDSSAIREGFQQVLPDTIYTDAQGYGWEGVDGLEARARVLGDPVENTSRGTMDPPAIYTNEITEDCITSTEPASFLASVPAGPHTVTVICGTSESQRYQFYDFTLAIGETVQGVQFEGGERFIWVTLPVEIGDDGLRIDIDPASRWVIAAVMVAGEMETSVVQDVIEPLRHEVTVAIPEEWEKWVEEPHVDSRAWFPLREKDVKRGYMVFRQHYLECVFPNTVPPEHALDPELRAFATLGEDEPLTFTVLPTERLSGVTVTASDLKLGDAVIPAS